MDPLAVDFGDKKRALGIDGHQMRQEQRLGIAPTGDDFAARIELEDLMDVAVGGEDVNVVIEGTLAQRGVRIEQAALPASRPRR